MYNAYDSFLYEISSMGKFGDVSTIILPNGRSIFLGDERTMADICFLEDFNISQILNFSHTQIPDDTVANVRHYKIDDSEDAKIETFFSECVDLLDDEHEITLICCAMGVSRSPSILAAYLISKFNMSSEDAIAYIKYYREIVSPNKGFLQQLKEYHQKQLNARSCEV